MSLDRILAAPGLYVVIYEDGSEAPLVGWSVDEDGESYPVVVSMQTGKLYVAEGAIRLVEQDHPHRR